MLLESDKYRLDDIITALEKQLAELRKLRAQWDPPQPPSGPPPCILHPRPEAARGFTIAAAPFDVPDDRRKIETIKAIRQFTDWGLKETKDFTERRPADRTVYTFDMRAPRDVAGSTPTAHMMYVLAQLQNMATALAQLGCTIEWITEKT